MSEPQFFIWNCIVTVVNAKGRKVESTHPLTIRNDAFVINQAHLTQAITHAIKERAASDGVDDLTRYNGYVHGPWYLGKMTQNEFTGTMPVGEPDGSEPTN